MTNIFEIYISSCKSNRFIFHDGRQMYKLTEDHINYDHVQGAAIHPEQISLILLCELLKSLPLLDFSKQHVAPEHCNTFNFTQIIPIIQK